MDKRKKLLLLGGTNCADEIKEYAKNNNVCLTATGIYPDTILKRISEEAYDVDAADPDLLTKLVKEANIDGIFTGCNEYIVPKAIQAATACDLPRYCNVDQWDICMNKEKFKQLCIENDVPVAQKYAIEELKEKDFPVVVKPADSCGSQGFNICNTIDEVKAAIERAVKFSRTNSVLIEQYMPYDAAIIHYTAIDGNIYFCGMSDKKSSSLQGKNSSVMSLQVFPSDFTNTYIEKLDKKVVKMFKSIGIQNGPIWIEAFNNNGDIYFNEMGYRFGGSMTFHPVKYFYGIDQLELLLDYSLGNKKEPVVPVLKNTNKQYCILPLHVSSGIIDKIIGEDYLVNAEYMYKYIPIHSVGDKIKADATVNQVFCYLHILFDDAENLNSIIKDVLDNLKVYDRDNNNLLFCLANKGGSL